MLFIAILKKKLFYFSIMNSKIWLLRGLFFFIVILVQACVSPLGDHVDGNLSDQYYYDQNKEVILYCKAGMWPDFDASNIKADVKTFKVLSGNFGKDKDNIFFQNVIINDERIDKESFNVVANYLSSGVCRDKKNVFIIDNTGEVVKVIKDVDTKTYVVKEMLVDNVILWAKDKNNYYYKGSPVDVDYSTFKIQNSSFCIDANRVYYCSVNKIKPFKADMNSLKVFAYKYMYDKDYVYWYVDYKYDVYGDEESAELIDLLIKIKYKDVNSLREIASSYIKIDNTIYCQGFKMKEIDVNSYEFVSQYYIKDKDHVFYLGNVIPKADAASFEAHREGMGWKDKNNYYRYGKVIEKDSVVTY